MIKKNCNFSNVDVTSECDNALNEYFAVYDIIDGYSLYAPTCIEANNTSSARQLWKINGISPKVLYKYHSWYRMQLAMILVSQTIARCTSIGQMCRKPCMPMSQTFHTVGPIAAM